MCITNRRENDCYVYLSIYIDCEARKNLRLIFDFILHEQSAGILKRSKLGGNYLFGFSSTKKVHLWPNFERKKKIDVIIEIPPFISVYFSFSFLFYGTRVIGSTWTWWKYELILLFDDFAKVTFLGLFTYSNCKVVVGHFILYSTKYKLCSIWIMLYIWMRVSFFYQRWNFNFLCQN